MKNFSIVLLILGALALGCTRTRNEVLLDDQIPPEDQLVKVSAEDLAEDFARGKKRSLTQDNDADKKYSGKWLKVTGTVESFNDKKDGFGYSIDLYTFAAHPNVSCIGNNGEKDSEISLKRNQKITVVGKLVSSGNASTLFLNPCKFVN